MSEYGIALLAVGFFGVVLLALAILHKPHTSTPNKTLQRTVNRR
jgi:hypothetical protein